MQMSLKEKIMSKKIITECVTLSNGKPTKSPHTALLKTQISLADDECLCTSPNYGSVA
jgi:hypothetical protein